MPPSRQFEHLQRTSLARLQALIPHDCPLVVTRPPAGGFLACTLDGHDGLRGRYQVVAAWITGYVAAWAVWSPR